MNIRTLTAILLLYTTGLIAGEQDASSIQAGKKLVNAHCISCHAGSFGGDGSGIYTRDYRKVRSLSGLKAQVTNCNTMLNLKWFDDEEQQVVLYLNQTYYHF